MAGGGIMAVIMDTEDGDLEAISEATGVVDPEVCGLSPISDLEDTDDLILATLRLKQFNSTIFAQFSKFLFVKIVFLKYINCFSSKKETNKHQNQVFLLLKYIEKEKKKKRYICRKNINTVITTKIIMFSCEIFVLLS